MMDWLWPPNPPPPPEPVDPVKLMIEQVLADEEFMGPLREAITQTIRQAFKSVITEVIKEQIPKSEQYQTVRAECIEQLNRWPSLLLDEELKLKVAKTILNSFQVSR